MEKGKLTRRHFLRLAALGGVGAIVTACSALTMLVRFSEADEKSVREEIERRKRIAMGEAPGLAREAA